MLDMMQFGATPSKEYACSCVCFFSNKLCSALLSPGILRRGGRNKGLGSPGIGGGGLSTPQKSLPPTPMRAAELPAALQTPVRLLALPELLPAAPPVTPSQLLANFSPSAYLDANAFALTPARC